MIDRLIRPAQENDLAAIVAIHNDVMQTSFTIWREKPTSVAERQKWLTESSTMGYPVLVARDASGVLGFIAAEPFRPWPGYAATWEHSVHVRQDVRSRGVGGCLLDAMQATLRTRGAHVMVAGIDSENEGSLRFHVRAGFLETGRMPEVGHMRGSWRNLILLQKTLTPLATGAPAWHYRNLAGPLNGRRKRLQ
jgi:L-amino acid N-acyltransferase YncA